MTKLEMMTKSTDFYMAESVRLLSENLKCKTEKEKKKSRQKILSLRAKIKFEIGEISKMLEETGESDEDGDDWKKA